MKTTNKTDSLFARLRSHTWLLGLVWTGAVVTSLMWNLHEQADKSLKMARNSAQLTLENDIMYRRWVSRQGGVYVPVSVLTPPNPYLKVPERDVVTTSGLSLTLVNPAYMARLVHEFVGQSGGIRGHITSLRPLRPENRPDAWETAALRAFEKGAREVSSVDMMEDGAHLRLMRPFVTEKACLKCHAVQGYKEGDIRGGISVSVSMAPFRAIENPMAGNLALAHLALWMLGLAGIGISKQGWEHQLLARQRAEETLRTTVDELARSNKDLEHFAYLASHDLQEPLRTVRAYAQLLHTRYKGKMDADADEFIDYVVGGAGRMQALILDLLAYSSVSSVSRRVAPTQAESALKSALKGLEEALKSTGATVTHDLLPTVMADRKQMTQLFENLVANGIKYHRKGISPLVHVAARETENEWTFSVRDNGIGIEPQYHEKIFTIFQRLHGPNEYSGTGIGLTICKRIVERHGGRIWLESQPGEGTTFFFSLPK